MDSLIDIIQESLYGSDNKLDKYRHLINSIENLQQYEKDIVLFSKLLEDLENDDTRINDCADLAKYRIFPKKFFVEKGIFYYENISIYKRFPYLQKSSIGQAFNYPFDERYLLPIRLPNGKVFTFMGYTHEIDREKYTVAQLPWINQGNMIGNLESLKKYPNSRVVKVIEGMMDAYRVELMEGVPALALLGSVIKPQKRAILSYLKTHYNKQLNYIPDRGKTGTSSKLLNDPLWDVIETYDEGKDIDQNYAIKIKNKQIEMEW